MDKKNLVRYKAGLAALMIASGMTLSGCGSKGFKLTTDSDRNIVAEEDSYVDNNYIKKCYVVEARSNLTGDSNIYFVRKESSLNLPLGVYYCIDVFTNEFIFRSDSDFDDSFEVLNEIPLHDYLVSLDMVKGLYSYEDMKKIYEEIKSVYTFEEEKELVK